MAVQDKNRCDTQVTTFGLISAGLALLVLCIWWVKRQASSLGEAKAKNQGLKKVVDNVQKAHEIDEDVSKLSNADLHDELYGNRADK